MHYKKKSTSICFDLQNKYLTEIKIHLLEEQNYDNLSLEQKSVSFCLKSKYLSMKYKNVFPLN